MNTTPKLDERDDTPVKNRTRRSKSLPRKFIRNGEFHWLLLYPLLRLSDLVREGMDHSGSYRFADHIYLNRPSGRLGLGRWIDARLLASPASRAFRQRCQEAQNALQRSFDLVNERPVRLLAVPCGLPRDLVGLARANPSELARIDYHGLDIDSELLGLADVFTKDCGVPQRTFTQGNALKPEDYPRHDFDAVVSTGLGEFLNDDELALFYRNVHGALTPGGLFFTSATRCEPKSEALLRAFELDTHYRVEADLQKALSPLGWSRLEFTHDPTGLQTFVIAVK